MVEQINEFITGEHPVALQSLALRVLLTLVTVSIILAILHKLHKFVMTCFVQDRIRYQGIAVLAKEKYRLICNICRPPTM